MSAEKTFEQRFAEVYPHIYFKLKSEETFDEEQWQVGLATEVSLAEKTLTKVQKDFFAAIRAADLKTVQFLILRERSAPGFSLSVLLPSIDYWQMTNPLHPAQPHFSVEIRDVIWNLILSHSDEHTFDELLRWAIVLYQSDDVIQEFLDDPNSVDAQGLTLLHLACSFNQESTVAFLLEQEADPLSKDKAGNLPLRFACANNHLGIVMRLLNKMTDRSCIPEILESGIVYSSDVREALEIYAKVSAIPTEKKTQTMSAAFLARNGLHATKPTPPLVKAVEKEKAPPTLRPDITAAWNQRVAEAEAEAKQKRQKLGN